MLKKCFICGEWKHSENDFYATKRNLTGRQGTCKACRIAYAIERYHRTKKHSDYKKVMG